MRRLTVALPVAAEETISTRAIFAGAKETTLRASAEEVDGMNAYTERFRSTLPVEKEAIRCLRD
mgnify:CR=1 FL=1